MSFLAPYMLWGTLAAGVPIALHFFFRSRYRRVPWAAMKFLLTSIEQTSRRLRFQELLLLAARVALLVLLALALSRPSSTKGGGSQGEAVDAVFVIDNSLSMDARDGPVTRLQRAKEAATAVLDHLPPHSTVQVFACADRATLLGPRAPLDIELARELINGLEISHLATDLWPGVKEAAALLERTGFANKELYLFSDMQKLGWEQQASALRDQIQTVHRQAATYLVRCGTRAPRNVAVVGIVPQSGIPHTGERAGFSVLVRNSGAEALRDLTIALTVDGQGTESQPLPLLAPGETKAVPLTARLERPGLRVLTATIKPDELEADNRFDQVIHVRDQVRLLVVDGSPNEREPEKAASFYLMHGLLPVKEADKAAYHIQPRLVTARQAAPSLLAGKDLCILVNAGLPAEGDGKVDGLSQEFVDELAAFVREGHGLLIFAGDHTAAAPYNRIFRDQHALLPFKLSADVIDSTADPLHLDRDSADSPFFAVFRTDDYYKSLTTVSIRRCLGVEEPQKNKEAAALATDKGVARVMLRYSNGRPALVSHKVGAGNVLLVTTSADLSWNDWPLVKGMYVPFLDMSLNLLLQGQTQNHNLTSGEAIHWFVPEKLSSQSFALAHPDGKVERLASSDSIDGRAVITASNTDRAGVYQLMPADERRAFPPREPAAAGVRVPPPDEEPVPFAVVPDARETENLDSFTDLQLDERLGFTPIHLTAGEDLSVFSGAERLNREWTLWLLLAALAVALGETALAWLCGRPW
ncbi:MAG TPA: BatA domain-containing protein [Gemmataceae bacterium]|jgi:hypothetical protein|nr:BatA domain-containing protein [Gemmataceae bacterium]